MKFIFFIVLALGIVVICSVFYFKESTVLKQESLNNSKESILSSFNTIRGFSSKFPKPVQMYKLRQKTALLANRNPQKLYISGMPHSKTVALTFDDAPNSHTATILDVLKKNGIYAAFFCVGQNVVRHKKLVKRMYLEGHIVANHSYSHLKITEIPDSLFCDEINNTEKIIDDIINKKTAFFRMPYGRIDSISLQKLHFSGYKTIAWSLDTFDWLTDENEILSIINKNITGGDIVLLHSRKKTAQTLQQIIHLLIKKQLKPIRLDSLLLLNAYK